jgi:hypothetical protein
MALGHHWPFNIHGVDTVQHNFVAPQVLLLRSRESRTLRQLHKSFSKIFNLSRAAVKIEVKMYPRGDRRESTTIIDRLRPFNDSSSDPFPGLQRVVSFGGHLPEKIGEFNPRGPGSRLDQKIRTFIGSNLPLRERWQIILKFIQVKNARNPYSSICAVQVTSILSF